MGLWRYFHRDEAKENRSGIVHVTGSFVTSTSGALVTTSSDSPGFTLTKVNAKSGRYLVTFVNSDALAANVYKITHFSYAIMSAVADTAYTTTKAGLAMLRNATPALITVNTNGQVLVQFVDKAFADAELEDGAAFTLSFDVKISTSVP